MNCRLLCWKLRPLLFCKTSTRVLVALSYHRNRFCSVANGDQALQPPSADFTAKEYPAKIKQLVDDISKLTVLEISDLNELLKTTLNITEIASMPASAFSTAAAPLQAGTEESQAEEQSEFTVKLMGFADGSKAKVIKEIKTIMEGMNLVQAKKFVEESPQVVRKDISKEEAEELKRILETAGATVELE